jgi:hypothetical protein
MEHVRRGTLIVISGASLGLCNLLPLALKGPFTASVILPRSGYAQLAHPVIESRSIQAEARGRAVGTADHPV